MQAGDYSAPADCPKALISNVFDATKTTERDASIETEFGRECQRFGRVLDAECVLRGPDAGALLISFTAVDAARKCCVAMHGRTFDGRGLRCEQGRRLHELMLVVHDRGGASGPVFAHTE